MYRQVEQWITYVVYAVLLTFVGEIFSPDTAMYVGLAWVINYLDWRD